MSDIKWIKLSVDMFDDEKIKLIRSMPEGNAILVVWIQLLSLAGKTNDSGMIYISRHMAYSEEMLATIFNHPLNVVRLALATLASFGLIEVNPEGVINITNWEKHQNIEGMERVRKLNAERVRKHRERQKQSELPPPNESNVTVTLRNATEEELDKELELDIDKEIKKEKNTSSSASLTDDFEKLWSLYPKKTLKKDAFAAYKKAIKNGVTNKQIQEGIVAYKKDLAANSWKSPADGGRWFKKERWEDDYHSSTRKPEGEGSKRTNGRLEY